MPRYICLMQLTDKGIKEISSAPQRIEDAFKGVDAIGGKMIEFYSVMGEYDYIAIAEAPNDEVAMAFLLVLGSMGNVRTTTLKAFTREEFTAVVKRLQ